MLIARCSRVAFQAGARAVSSDQQALESLWAGLNELVMAELGSMDPKALIAWWLVRFSVAAPWELMHGSIDAHAETRVYALDEARAGRPPVWYRVILSNTLRPFERALTAFHEAQHIVEFEDGFRPSASAALSSTGTMCCHHRDFVAFDTEYPALALRRGYL